MDSKLTPENAFCLAIVAAFAFCSFLLLVIRPSPRQLPIEAPVYAVPYVAFTNCQQVCQTFSGLKFVTSMQQCICGDGHQHWTEFLP